jgi:hypothetical protein
VPYGPAFEDRWAVPGETYYYRVRARNSGGTSDPSAVAGPVRAASPTVVDELADFSRTFAHAGLRAITTDTRKAKEDLNRAGGEQGATLTYRTAGPLAAARVQAFFPAEIADPAFETSSDGFTWIAATASRHDFSKGAGDYGYYKAIGYEIAVAPGQAFLRLTLATRTEIGRVELDLAGGTAR